MLKTIFKLPTTQQEAELLTHFCKPQKTGWDRKSIVFANHPELKKLLKDKNENEYYQPIYNYIEKLLSKRKGELQNLAEQYQNKWDKINDEYIQILQSHFDITPPERITEMTAFISVVPIFPRYLDKWSFNVSSKNPDMAVPIAMHEILHFFYFEKWMQVFPETKPEQRNAPHLVWRISEILDPIILNNNPEIQKLFPYTEHKHYKQFESVKIGDIGLIEHFENIYKNHLESGDGFDIFLKTCWEEANKHKNIIKNI